MNAGLRAGYPEMSGEPGRHTQAVLAEDVRD